MTTSENITQGEVLGSETKNWEKLEWQFVLGRGEVEVEEKSSEEGLVEKWGKGEFEKILSSGFSKQWLNFNYIEEEGGVEGEEEKGRVARVWRSYRTQLQNRVKNELTNPTTPESPHLLLCMGVAFLNLFVQVGWTGPHSELELFDLLPKAISELDREVTLRFILKELAVDGEEAYHLVTKPILLYLAEMFLEVLAAHCQESLKTCDWWYARALFIKQRILDNPTGTLQTQLDSLMTKVHTKLPSQATPGILTPRQLKQLHGRFHIELGLQEHLFYNDREAVKKFSQAQETVGLRWKLTGALGKRTKFQQKEVTQLVLWAKSQPDEEDGEDVVPPSDLSKPTMPKNFDLNDDTLLEKISFAEVQSQGNPEEEDVANQSPLNPADQCILLAFCLNIKNTNPSHGLTTEQMMPYVSRVLENPGNWMVYTMALLLRSRLESHKTRTVERSLFQLQALVDQFGLTESTVVERLEHFYSLLLPSKWEMEKELANRFMSLGAIRSAIEIFKKLEMWEELVQSYCMTEDNDKALEVVESQLELYPDSPKLLCLKGEVLLQPEWWYKAWEVSGNRYGRAMRALGSHYFKHDQFLESVECYTKALKVNPLFENSWFICGCAAMRIEDWETAKTAFQKVVTLDPENGEAWCNLSSSFARLGSKSEAFFALHMAIKQNYSSWKMWTNNLYLSIDLCKFSEAINSFERIITLRWESEKERCVDKEILSILITVISTDAEDFSGQRAGRLRPKLLNLIQIITDRIAGDPGIWQLAAKFYASSQDRDLALALDCSIKAYRCSLNHPDLLSSHDAFAACASAALELVDAYTNYGPLPASPTTPDVPLCRDWHYQCRLLLRSLISRTRDSFETDPEHDLLVTALKSLPPADSN